MQRIFTQVFGVVGAILEKDEKFLLVREAMPEKPDHGKWNIPAGWIDVGEHPLDAARREVLEETGLPFTPTHLLGLYSLVRTDLERHYGTPPHSLKLVFLGTFDETRAVSLHDDVSETRWYTAEEIYAMGPETLRNLDIKQQVKDYLAGKRFPLDVLTHTLVPKS